MHSPEFHESTSPYLFIAALFPVMGLGHPPGLPVPEHIRPLLQDEHYQVEPDLDFPKEISDVLNKTVINGGKRVRPLLCFLSAGLIGVDAASAKPFACIVEFTHQASLIHDDVIDASATRRGAPSLWNQSTVTEAVLIGDWLIDEANLLATRTNRMEHVASINRTGKNMVRGEIAQRAAISRGNYSMEDWQQVAKYKTGVLFAWALTAPAVQHELDEQTVALLQELGETLGTLFQLQDDIKDAEDERGEMNFVLLMASAFDNVSPFSKLFSSDALESGLSSAGMVLQAHRTRLSHLIQQLEIKTREASVLAGREVNVDHREACIRSLLDLAAILTMPPRIPAVLDGKKPR